MWNLLALKQTGADTAPVRHSVLHLYISLRDRRVGIDGIRIERFSGDCFNHDSDTPIQRTSGVRGLQYMTRDGELRRVPEYAYVHISISTSLVTGLVCMWGYYTKTGEYHIVEDEAEFFELVDRVNDWRSIRSTKSVCAAAANDNSSNGAGG